MTLEIIRKALLFLGMISFLLGPVASFASPLPDPAHPAMTASHGDHATAPAAKAMPGCPNHKTQGHDCDGCATALCAAGCPVLAIAPDAPAPLSPGGAASAAPSPILLVGLDRHTLPLPPP